MILSDAAGASVAEGERWSEAVLGPVLAAARPGTVLVQLRHKELPFEERLRWGEGLRRLTAATEQLLLVNGSVELARRLGADGVHLPEGQGRVAAIRDGLPGIWVSRAWHGGPLREPQSDPEGPPAGDASGSPEQPDGWVVSPVWEPRKGQPALGAQGLAEVVAEAEGLPGAPAIFALGGVDVGAVPATLAAGARGVAVLGAASSLDGALGLVAALGIEREGPGAG